MELTKLDEFSACLKRVPMTEGFVKQMDILKERYGDEYTQIAEAILSLFELLNLDPVNIGRKYIFDYLKQLDYFIKHQEYGHTDFDEVRENIYDNEKTMLETYMPGLLISYAYTTILYEKNHLFVSKFLPGLEEKFSDKMIGLEVGFGEGFYLWEVLKRCSNAKVFGYDISPYAIKFASNMLSLAEITSDRYELRYGNIFEGIEQSDESVDFAILAEVIEHIPNPEIGIKEICRMLRKGGRLYLTTVINSNHMDHISNFESPAVVESMIESESLKIVESKIYHMTDDFPESKDISIGLAYIAEKI